MNVNRAENLWQLDGAHDDELITAHHDMQMLKDMLFTTDLQGKDPQ